ncbi:hypothetical protein FOA52_004513 [Chlamydomonas sp. UWO 241]|nr:hypothetical protein FOA52_004513 [Chlamydomonas sp. UWO 241]
MQHSDSGTLMQRIEHLEGAIATALRVNSLSNREINRYAVAGDKLGGERDAWRAHARSLAKRLDAVRKEDAGLVGDDDERLAAYLEGLESEAAARTAGDAGTSSLEGMPVEPSEAQARVISALLSRGRASGWLVDPAEVVMGEVLGAGAFGTTYKGTWRGGTVACKAVRISKPSELTTFLREVEAMSLLRHPNIVPFLGASIQPPDSFLLLSEFMTGGTLAGWLRPPGASVSVRSLAERAKAGLEVARGMQALHGQSPVIIHRDLKPSNVFVDGAGCARVADFGLARRLLAHESRASLTGETGTYLYMAPEVMRHDVYDLQCDVWSWGVLFAELMDWGRFPYWQTYLSPVQVALAVAEERLAPSMPDDLPTDLQVIGRLACQFDPESRPSFEMIISELAPAVDAELRAGASGATLLGRVAQFTSAWGGVMGRAMYAQFEGPGTAAGGKAGGRAKAAGA